MSNSLVTVEWMNRLLAHQIEAQLEQIKRDEASLAAFMADHPGITPDDIVAEYGAWPRALRRFRVMTPDEKWAKWQSDNHGWARITVDDI